ncbi:switch-associated protein 70-like isoform X2 [Orbicella faveolata]|uniref:switch-associated protein 70-like isoform X2 n=1 Tax=Orbicella faveolata TaxID=48498 RepID=UPI0009E50154|nr:switch-associated protein 70-like isoform X2 [Orbicella faveolata]
MKEMQQYLGTLRQLKDFDENLGREIEAKAYQEQEIIKREEIARLQQENREQEMKMEMLLAKQQQETERLRKQMYAEAKAQRDQMDNMMKANMKQAEEDRRTLIQDNPALNKQLEMQKLTEGISMQQRIENLRQLHQNQLMLQEVKNPGHFDASCSVM